MKAGIELISEERQEQQNKHGFTIESDLNYKDGELVRAAKFCLSPHHLHLWPVDWNREVRVRIEGNDRISQLKKAGAFIAAEIDRLQNLI